jgi:hypothetical protein
MLCKGNYGGGPLCRLIDLEMARPGIDAVAQADGLGGYDDYEEVGGVEVKGKKEGRRKEGRKEGRKARRGWMRECGHDRLSVWGLVRPSVGVVIP